jgi:hypothetical protein
MNWQPIATAPRTGTRILIAVPTRHGLPHEVTVTWWDGYYKRWVCDMWSEATHWMPLPAPPAIEHDDTVDLDSFRPEWTRP